MDFDVVNGGSVFLLILVSEGAKAWVEEYLPDDAPSFGNGIAVEARYIGEILNGIQEAGFSFS